MSNLSDFLPLVGSSELFRIARTSNVSLSKDEKGKLIDITSGTFTQTFDSCATLGDGWFVYLKNSGTGDITLDPAGSETIDGLTSYIMYPGEARLIQCDGTVLRSLVVNAFYKVFTASGNFKKPPGYAAFEGLLWGGGGGGHANVNGSGGGGAACHKFSIDQNLLLSTESVTIGSGGSANSPGGTSTLGPIVAYGGFGSSSGGSGGGLLGTGTASVGGSPSLPVSVGTGDNPGFGGGARASSGAFAAGKSVYGGGGGGANGNPYFPGGDSVYGGGGGGAAGAGVGTANYPPAVGTGGQGGSSVYGGAGGAGGQTAGANGSAPGGGGGGGTTPGVGGRGELRIWGII